MNQNGVFEPTEIIFQKNTSSTTPTVGDTMTIPATAPIGITGMRVVLRAPTVATVNPCGTYTTYGETEDYLVNIQSAPAVPYSYTWNSTPAINTLNGSTLVTNFTSAPVTQTWTITAVEAATGWR